MTTTYVPPVDKIARDIQEQQQLTITLQARESERIAEQCKMLDRLIESLRAEALVEHGSY